MSKVVGSIVVYNPKISVISKTIETFLASVPAAEVFIWDNSETDRISKDIKKLFPSQVHYLKSPINSGYGRGNNAVFNQIPFNFDYFCVLNPDLEIPRESIPQLVSYMDTHSHLGLATGIIQGVDGAVHEVHKLLPTFADYVTVIYNRLLGRPRVNKIHVAPRVKMGQPFSLPVLSGCFLFFRRDHFQELKGFDERFFLYFEDNDITLRSFLQNKSIVLPDVKIIHRWARESHLRWKLFFAHMKSGLQFYAKWGFTSSLASKVNKSLR